MGDLTLEKLNIDARLRKVENNIVELKTIITEWRSSHNKEAIDRQKATCAKLNEILDFIHSQYERKTECMNEVKGYVKQAIAWALGIPAAIVSITFAIIKLKELFGG